MKKDLTERAKKIILQNFRVTGGRYISPSWPHYKMQWLWDSCFHAIVCAELGFKNLAKNEILTLLEWQQPQGWIPHLISHQIPLFLRQKIEWKFFKKEHRDQHSSHTQPPVLAQALEAISDPKFTGEIFDKVLNFYLYFDRYRDPDRDGLISILHPCEARDASPELRRVLPRFEGGFKFLNIFPWFRVFKLEREYQKINWEIEEIWKKNLFNVEDLMFHCIWVEGLRILKNFAPSPELSQKIKNLADRAEQAVFELCWDKKNRIFWSLSHPHHHKLEPLTISNLFPLILENLPREMAQGIVEHLTNPQEFWTPYPLPCVALNGQRRPTWFGNLFLLWGQPVIWINMVWFISRGLIKQGYRDLAKEILDKIYQMVEREGFWEFYHPFTGKGLRKITLNFCWSTLAITFPKLKDSL
jgi:hypothetical protein